MRAWPLLAASGASGGIAGVLPSLLEVERSPWFGGYHLPSVLIGFGLGICCGPLLDLLLLIRISLLRGLGRVSRPLSRLYRILE